MGITAEEIEFAKDLFSGLGPITTRRMMGGLCLYCDGTIFAIVMADSSIWIKGAGVFVQELEDMGQDRWSHTRKDGKEVQMPYWSLPGECLDDPDAAVALARRALRHL